MKYSYSENAPFGNHVDRKQTEAEQRTRKEKEGMGCNFLRGDECVLLACLEATMTNET